MTSLCQQLLDIGNSLTAENWIKCNYFATLRAKTICTCAHGAIQAARNPRIKRALENNPDLDPGHDIRQGIEAAVTLAIRSYGSPREVWDWRPDWVRNDHLLGTENYGNLDLHWLLGMVGLTVEFNDHPSTTLEMVKNKFKEAAELARQLSL